MGFLPANPHLVLVLTSANGNPCFGDNSAPLRHPNMPLVQLQPGVGFQNTQDVSTQELHRYVCNEHKLMHMHTLYAVVMLSFS